MKTALYRRGGEPSSCASLDRSARILTFDWSDRSTMPMINRAATPTSPASRGASVEPGSGVPWRRSLVRTSTRVAMRSSTASITGDEGSPFLNPGEFVVVRTGAWIFGFGNTM